MRLHIAKRHFFDGQKGLSALEQMLPNLEASAELGQSNDVSLSLWLSSPELEGALRDRANAAVVAAESCGIAVTYDRATAGEKFAEQLFPSSAPPDTILGLCCLDQFPLHEQRHLDAILSLANRLVRSNSAYATGSRNIPVRLARGEPSGSYRIIQELIHGLTSDCFSVEIMPLWASPSRWYAQIGETTSGLYLANPQSPAYGAIREAVRQNKNLSGFAVEYMAAILAGANGSVSTGYVYAAENPLRRNSSPQQVLDTIAETSVNLRQTQAWPQISRALERADELHCFFPEERVSAVVRAIRGSD